MMIKKIAEFIVLILIILMAGCAGSEVRENLNEAVDAENHISENTISENIAEGQQEEQQEEPAENEDVSAEQPINQTEDRPLSYNVEDYFYLTMEEAYAWLAPYGFGISEELGGDDEIWFVRYKEDGKEDRSVVFQYSETGQLEYISINDFGKAEEIWTLYGTDCRMTLEEMRDWVEKQGAAICGHNMVLYATGIGLEKLGIGRLDWGCGSDYIDYMNIHVNTDYVDILKDVTCDVESREAEFVTEAEDGRSFSTFTIEYPLFISDGENIYDNMNERLQQMIEENGWALSRAGNQDDILYDIECMETQGISISFYRNGDYHFQSLFTFNYDLIQEDIPEMPDDLLEEVEVHRNMWEERGPYGVLNWYINPMYVHVVYYNQLSGEVEGFDYWR